MSELSMSSDLDSGFAARANSFVVAERRPIARLLVQLPLIVQIIGVVVLIGIIIAEASPPRSQRLGQTSDVLGKQQ